MLRTIARTTDVEPGHVRAFEIREHGAEAVGQSRIPLLRRSGSVGPGNASHLANVAWTLSCHRRHVHPQGLLPR